jgi:hypothetical protein
MDFHWSDANDVDSSWFQAWNPRYDNLLLMETVRAKNGGDSVDVLDVSSQRVLKSVPDLDSTPVVWSGDGRAIVTVRNDHIVFEQLSSDFLR